LINDIGVFYRFVNSKSCCRSSVGTLIGPDGKTVACDKEKADSLNSYFGSVCTVDAGLSPQINAELHASEDSNITHIVFTEANVLKAARRIKTKSKFSGDSDGYPVILLHKLRPVLCGCLP